MVTKATGTKRASSISIQPEKRTTVVHQGKPDAKNIYEVLAETERTIRELSRVLAELPFSKHREVGGRAKITHKEKIILQQLSAAQKRANRLLDLIENIYK